MRKGLAVSVRKFAPVVVLAVVMWLAAGCFMSDRRSEAESIERQIRSMPGVGGLGTELSYDSGSIWKSQGPSFLLVVWLDPTITAQQAADIGRVFVDKTGHGFSRHGLEIDLRIPLKPDNFIDYSQASFKFGKPTGGVTRPSDVAASIRVWVHAVHSPVAEQVNLVSQGGDAASPGFDITLKSDATSAGAHELQDSDPALAHVLWHIRGEPDARYISESQHDLQSTTPPSDSVIAAWRQITTIVGRFQRATGVTATPVVAPRRAETEIEIYAPTGRDSEPEDRRIAMSVADLLPQFGHPVALTIYINDGRVELVVGGCWRHDKDQQRLPLELEMSRIYEHC
jgi:hypothetical protein